LNFGYSHKGKNCHSEIKSIVSFEFLMNSIYRELKLEKGVEIGSETLDKRKMETSVRKFKKFIEQNKDYQAYSDYKEGVNKGLDIAKYTFEENVEKFCILDTNEGQAVTIDCLHANFCQLLDRIVIAKKPNWSADHFEGLHTGFDRSKEIFREFVKESFPQKNM
jgi:hypothetical protein